VQFRIFGKPPRTVILQVGSGIGMTAAEEQHRG